MTPCARGCCWNPYGCSKQRACPCHWADNAPRNEPRHSDAQAYRDPTADQAVRNIMRERRRKK